MAKERKSSILRHYRRLYENQVWVWRINERWLKRTIHEVEFLTAYFSKGDKILDVGCGTGRHIIELCNRGYFAIGVDISPEMLCIARKKLLNGKIDEAELIQADASYLPFTDNSFNHVICMFSVFLELTIKKERLVTLNQMKRVIKSNGYIIMDLPYSASDPSWKPTDQRYEAISVEDRDFWELIFDEKGNIVDRVFIHYIDRKEVKELIEIAGLKLTEIIDKQWCDESRRIMIIIKKIKEPAAIK